MSLNNIEEISFCIHQDAPKIHCLTNPVTMQDVANLLLAAGGSAVMGQDEQEVEETLFSSWNPSEYRSTGHCQNTGLHPCRTEGKCPWPPCRPGSGRRRCQHISKKRAAKNFFKPFIRLLFAVIKKKPLFYVLFFQIPTVPRNTAV